MDKHIRFTVSIPPKEAELSHFMMEKVKHNGMSVSAYIRNLIRKDMENQINHDFEEIYQYVVKRLKETGIDLLANNKVSSNNIIDEIHKEIILELF
jgi:hypothetical protein